MRDIDRAVELLKPLFNGLAEDRNETVDVYADVYNGEDYITKNVISNMKSSFKDSSKLEPYLKVTKTYRTKDGSVNTKVGFYGYHKKGSKSFSVTSKSGTTYSYNGIPVPLIVIAREFGSSSGEAKKPFFRKSFNKSQIESEMLKVQKKYIKE